MKVTNSGCHFTYLIVGPGKESECGPFFQSSRIEHYKKYADHLLASEKAYRCYCSKERLTSLRDPHGNGRYDGHCRNLPSTNRSTESFVIRFRIPSSGITRITDVVYGTAMTPNRLIDDAVIIKSDGYPTYHFASVIDDHLMRITTVMRGQEWLPSTSLHLLLYDAFDWKPPRFAHLPLLIRRDGAKLSKRQNDSFVGWYREAGYFPQALLNFVAYLGWTPRTGSEVMDLDVMAQNVTARYGPINSSSPWMTLTGQMPLLIWKS